MTITVVSSKKSRKHNKKTFYTKIKVLERDFDSKIILTILNDQFSPRTYIRINKNDVNYT